MNIKEKIAFGKINQMRNDTLTSKKIRIGFVGGGPSSFIGYTHTSTDTEIKAYSKNDKKKGK